jgi:heme O synthase-like polyprenyltransferase
LQLVRLRLALLVLVTVATGWFLAANGEPDWLSLLHAVIRTALLFAGASALREVLRGAGHRSRPHDLIAANPLGG